MIEVELKFRVHDDRSLRKSLRELGARLVSTFDQRDQYMLHPSRDFRETDEAFRIRVEGESATLTYKGPKMDRQTKTRPEIEVALKHVGELDRAVQLLESLGFQRCRLVSKRRDTFFLEWRDVPTTLCLDWVEPLGHFVELELVVEPSQVGQAQQNVQSLAARLGLGESIIKSYLQMIEELPER